MRRTVRGWRIHRQTPATLADLAKQCNPAIRGWWNYFGTVLSDRDAQAVWLHRQQA
ncbi:MAG: group II intron maturase-specific domain-containing protein [Terracidiphilus sp.]